MMARKFKLSREQLEDMRGKNERLFTEIISLDIDSSLLELWKDDWLKAQKAILESCGYLLQRTIIRPSGEPLPWKKTQIETETKAKHFHVWHHIITPYKLSDMENLKLQFLLGSDYGRCWINYLRITKRKNVLWNKIFGYIVWRRPLEEPCKSCHLRKYLEELAECPTTQE